MKACVRDVFSHFAKYRFDEEDSEALQNLLSGRYSDLAGIRFHVKTCDLEVIEDHDPAASAYTEAGSSKVRREA